METDDNLTAEGAPVTDLRQPWQRIRRAGNGYIVEQTVFVDHWICEHEVFEQPESGDDNALERALFALAELVGRTEDIDRVCGKLFPREVDDED